MFYFYKQVSINLIIAKLHYVFMSIIYETIQLIVQSLNATFDILYTTGTKSDFGQLIKYKIKPNVTNGLISTNVFRSWNFISEHTEQIIGNTLLKVYHKF